MKLLKLLLYPISLLYGLVVAMYHLVYDLAILNAKSFEIPVISVGNISMGGTGKTPHTEYLIRLLGKNFKVAALSRGYGRITQGYLQVESEGDAAQFGDEPLMLKRKFPSKPIAVCENRKQGIVRLLNDFQGLNAILLDDAFQHRSIKPGMNILLSDYSNMFTEDTMFPTGYLREFKSGYQRADVIVVTKTPKIFSPLERRVFKSKLQPKPYQKVFFSYTSYGNLIPVYSRSLSKMLNKDEYLNISCSVLLVTGIAKPTNLYYYLKDTVKEVIHMKYPDHHRFNHTDCQKIADAFVGITNDTKLILTTEKDAIRLVQPAIASILENYPVYYIPIKVEFHENDKEEFDNLIKEYVRRNQAKR